MCVCACVRACVRVCMCACVRACECVDPGKEKEKISRRSSGVSNPRPFDHESGAPATELSPVPVWPVIAYTVCSWMAPSPGSSRGSTDCGWPGASTSRPSARCGSLGVDCRTSSNPVREPQGCAITTDVAGGDPTPTSPLLIMPQVRKRPLASYVPSQRNTVKRLAGHLLCSRWEKKHTTLG